MSDVNSLSTTTKVLHISVATFMICLLCVGWYMHEFEAFDLYPIHKSFGVLVLVLALIRIRWRIKKGWPTPVGTSSAIQLFAAKIVHWILIVSTLVYPISGIMGSVGGGHGLAFFGIELAAANIDAVTGDKIAVNQTIADIGHEVHELLLWLVLIALVLHVAGALKHHIIDKDETLSRMFKF